MGVHIGAVIDVCAAMGNGNEPAEIELHQPSDHLSLGEPEEGIVHADPAAQNLREEALKTPENARMGGARSACAYHIGYRGQVQTHRAVFEKADARATEQMAHEASKNRIEKRAAALASLLRLQPLNCCGDGDVPKGAGAGRFAQLCHQAR